MAKKSNRFTDRFPHFGLFLVIAIALAIPLTVWSLNNVSTITQQEAALRDVYDCIHRSPDCPSSIYPYCTTFSYSQYYRCAPPKCVMHNLYGNDSSIWTTSCAQTPCSYKGGFCYSSVLCKGRGGTVISGTSGCKTGTICCKL